MLVTGGYWLLQSTGGMAYKKLIFLYGSMQKLHATAMQLFFFGFQCSYSL